MKTYKHFTLLLFFGIFLSLFLIVIINIVVDPFEIFGSKILKHQFQMNERYAKIEYLKKNHNKYNSYILGSSRVGTTSPAQVEKYIKNSNFYNMTVSSATLYDDRVFLEYFLNSKYDVKNIYLQIDIADNLMQYKPIDSDLLRKHHPDILNQDYFHYYVSYLISFPFANIKGKIITNLKGKDEIIFDISKTGRWFKPLKELYMQEHPEEYIKNEPLFHIQHNRDLKGLKTTQNLVELKKIQTLCKEHNINLIIFITPHNQHMMDSFVLDDYYGFLRDIANITDYWDFSGYNSVTTNDHNYYEDSHYKDDIAKLIAARIFNDTSVSIPDDFGVFVTQNHIGLHIKNLKAQIPEEQRK